MPALPPFILALLPLMALLSFMPAMLLFTAVIMMKMMPCMPAAVSLTAAVLTFRVQLPEDVGPRFTWPKFKVRSYIPTPPIYPMSYVMVPDNLPTYAPDTLCPMPLLPSAYATDTIRPMRPIR